MASQKYKGKHTCKDPFKGKYTRKIVVQPVRLSNKICEEQKKPPCGRIFLFDSVVPNLGLRCDRRGKNWIYKYTTQSECVVIQFGSFPKITVDEARKQTRAWQQCVELSVDVAKVDELHNRTKVYRTPTFLSVYASQYKGAKK